METGSMVNGMMSGSEQITPEIGMGVTLTGGTDRTAGTIIKITPTTITVQEDEVTRIDKNGMSEIQEYAYERNENGSVYVFRKTKRGYRCKESGKGLGIGYRKAYHDYSF